VVRPLAAQVGSRPPAKLLVNQGHEFFSCLEVPPSPCAQ
jgi:hypothetical protein